MVTEKNYNKQKNHQRNYGIKFKHRINFKFEAMLL